MSNFFFKLHSIQYYYLLRYNHTPLCKVAYNWLSVTLTIYHKYLTKKKRNVPEKERTNNSRNHVLFMYYHTLSYALTLWNGGRSFERISFLPIEFSIP